MVDRLSIYDPLNESAITKLPAVYCTIIARNIIQLLEDSLIYYELTHVATKCICLIIVLWSLRCLIFNLIQVTFVARNMGEYKALYRIPLWFVWPTNKFWCHWMDKRVFPLYGYISLTTSRSRVSVFLASQLFLHYSSCRFIVSRSPYWFQW